jgi:fermentation-respiration switch protein FrsA (DUF1100 family)
MPTMIRPTPRAIAETADEDLSRYFQAEPEHQLVADPSRRQEVTFASDGLSLAGHLYRPPNVGEQERTAGVVMLGPVSSVKEQTLPHYAERLSDAGFTVLTVDPRSFGASEGEPRWHYVPEHVIADYVNACAYMMTRPDVDPKGVAAVGVCMGGGFAVSAAARDHRIAACVSVAGGFDIGGTFQLLMGPEALDGYLRKINELHQRERETGTVQYVPAIEAKGLSDAVPVAVMPNAEAASYYERTSKDHAPNWSDRMTATGLEAYLAYNGLSDAKLLAPTPLLIVHGTQDFALLPEFAQAAYDNALGPKQLSWIETHNHVELYDQDPYVSQAADAVVAFLGERLGLGGG